MSSSPIVAGTDGSPTATVAVDRAGDLAAALGATVHIVCVPSYIAAQDWPPRITAQQIVAEASDRLRSRGIAVETHLPAGDAAPSLVEVADSEQAQMIVMGNKGMTGLRRLFGSLPNRVSHQARCDVLIVPTESGSPAAFGGAAIVVGTDGSSGATYAVERAIRLARALDGELHIVSSAMPADAAEGALSAAAAAAAREGVRATVHAVQDEPVKAILGVAEKHGASIVVVGGKGMHSGERDWLGNIPDKLSHSGACSVLIAFTDIIRAGKDEPMSAAVAGTGSSPGDELGA
jgi:nucleotide-binding universal stress UspA family protein